MRNVKDRAGGIDELKNRSEKCEGPDGGGGGIDEIKNRSGKCEGPGEGKLDECIMHRVLTSLVYPL